MNTTTMSFETRDDLDIGMYECEDRDTAEYYDALSAADEAGEPWFSFDEFLARRARRAAALASTLPAPADDSDDEDNIPF
jgi:hypothetical protein